MNFCSKLKFGALTRLQAISKACAGTEDVYPVEGDG